MAAAAERGKCCECNQPCFVGLENSCCPKGCKRCVLKKCKEQKKCKCNECNCGCQLEENKGKLCKDLGCPDCVGLCKNVKPGDKCLCSTCNCGCEDAFKKNKLCYENGSNKCPECKKKCQNSKDGDCICYLCNCGCNGVNCQCCRWCNPPTACKGEGTCDTEEKHGDMCPKGKCKQKPGSCADVQCMCKAMGMVEREDLCECKCKCGKQCPRILCDRAKKSCQSRICGEFSSDCTCECTCNCNAYGKYYCKNHKAGDKGCDINKCDIIFYGIGECRFKCTNCGRLCDQDRCMNWIRVIVIGLIILASLFVLRAIFPEKFRAIMTKIRATFASAPVHAGRSLNNLVGDKIPEEMNIDRYPAISPGTFAGLS